MRHTKSFRGHSAQRGVARIMVLLVVALAVALSTSIAKRQSEAIRATSSHFNDNRRCFMQGVAKNGRGSSLRRT